MFSSSAYARLPGFAFASGDRLGDALYSLKLAGRRRGGSHEVGDVLSTTVVCLVVDLKGRTK